MINSTDELRGALDNIRAEVEEGVSAAQDATKELSRDLVATEKETPPHEDEDRGKAALTELFQQAKNDQTPVIVERVVTDIDEIVRLVRFPGWQQTAAGEREVKKALRRTLFKYRLHQEQELFDRAYRYIEMYY